MLDPYKGRREARRCELLNDATQRAEFEFETINRRRREGAIESACGEGIKVMGRYRLHDINLWSRRLKLICNSINVCSKVIWSSHIKSFMYCRRRIRSCPTGG